MEGKEGSSSQPNHSEKSSSQGESNRRQPPHLPNANVTKIMRRVLPPGAIISDESLETVQKCVSEFIAVITTGAVEHCHNEVRKTITADDILCSLGFKGFNNYVPPLATYLNMVREHEGSKHSPFVPKLVGSTRALGGNNPGHLEIVTDEGDSNVVTEDS